MILNVPPTRYPSTSTSGHHTRHTNDELTTVATRSIRICFVQPLGQANLIILIYLARE